MVSLATSPIELNMEQSENLYSWNLEVPEDLLYFDGHFPGHPIVPGVAQLQWIMDLAQTQLGFLPSVQRIEALKFQEPLLPGQRFQLTIDLSPCKTKLKFTITQGESTSSSGRFILDSEDHQ